jgi:hypothetical protein
MRRKPAHRLVPDESHGARLAWWAAFVATVALIAILNFVRSAEASTLPLAPAASPSLLVSEAEEEGEVEEEEGTVEECEEVAEDELRCFAVESEEAAPSECRLTSTDAFFSVTPRGRLRLTVHYVAAAPTMVAVDSRLRGSKGSLNLDGERGRFAGSGSFHETELLGPAQTARALAARSVMVEIRPLGAPHYCHVYFDQRLVTRHPAAHGALRLS